MTQNFSNIAKTWNNKVWAKDTDFAYNIVKYANLNGNEHALYVGVGTGEIAGKFNVKDLLGLDVSKEMMEECKSIPKHKLIIGDVNNIPFMDNSFDFVFARNLLKHVDNPSESIKEMRRVTKPNGVVFIVESCVIDGKDKEYPTFCVRTTEPNHNEFKTFGEISKLFWDTQFSKVIGDIYSYKSKWLDKWIESVGATKETKQLILDKYRMASEEFKNRQQVKFTGDDIESIIYWAFIKGIKK